MLSSGGAPGAPLSLPPSAARVRVQVSGPESAEYELSRSVTILGSRRDCDIPILCADVSKVHCAIVNTGAAVCLIDLCSRCGTTVDAREVDVVPLGPETLVQVGSAEVRILVEAGKPAIREIGLDPLKLRQPLELVRGEQRDVVTKSPAIIGRRNACHVRVDTPDASLAHALIAQIGGRPAIFDLGSRSGTFLNGERTAAEFLASGDEIRIGGQAFSVVTGPRPAARPASAARAGAAEAVVPPPAAAPPVVATPAAEAPPLAILAYIQASVQRLCDDFRAQEEALASREVTLCQREQLLAKEQASLEEWRQALERKEQELRERESALSRREAVGEGVKRQMRQIRKPPNDAPADADKPQSADEPRGASAAPPAGSLPAPLIARPLFSGPDPDRSVPTRRNPRGNA